jgi:hypothetical protein
MNLIAMNTLNKTMRYFATVLVVTLIVACGGGGGGGSDKPTTPKDPPPAPIGYTQGQAKTAANLGFLTSELLFNRLQDESSSFPYFVQGFLSTGTLRSPGLYSNTRSCMSNGLGTGTLSLVITLNGNASDPARAGLMPGDTISLDYLNCDYAGEGIVKNGNAVITSQGTYPSLGAISPTIADFRFKFNLLTNNYSVSSGTAQKILTNGSEDIDFSSTVNASSLAISSKVVSSYTANYFKPSNAAVSTSANKLDAGFTLSTKRNFGNASFELQVDGSASLGTESANLPFTLSTPGKLGGNVAGGRLAPLSGVMLAKDLSAKLLTQTTWTANSVAVSADSNQDGSLDLNFSYPSHALFIAP